MAPDDTDTTLIPLTKERQRLRATSRYRSLPFLRNLRPLRRQRSFPFTAGMLLRGAAQSTSRASLGMTTVGERSA